MSQGVKGTGFGTANSARVTQWRLDNPEKYRAQQLRSNERRRLARPSIQHGVRTAYSTIHNALQRERGYASAHACVKCGEQARDWAFDEPTGFSTDLSRYSPLCRSCHLIKDRRI